MIIAVWLQKDCTTLYKYIQSIRGFSIKSILITVLETKTLEIVNKYGVEICKHTADIKSKRLLTNISDSHSN